MTSLVIRHNYINFLLNHTFARIEGPNVDINGSIVFINDVPEQVYGSVDITGVHIEATTLETSTDVVSSIDTVSGFHGLNLNQQQINMSFVYVYYIEDQIPVR